MASAAKSTLAGSPEPSGPPQPCGPRKDSTWVLRLMEAEGAGILRMLWRLLGSEQDVMDAYQDCFCKLVMRRSGRDLGNPRAYVYRTAANIAIEFIRARRCRAAHLPSIAARQEAIQSGGIDRRPRDPGLDHLRDALERLPAHLRNVVVLRDLSRMSYDEVGRTLGIEPTTARVYRRHAVLKLGELLTEGAA